MTRVIDWPLAQHDRRGFAQPSAVVIHYTGGMGVASRWIRMSGVSVSYHVEIARGGEIYRCVPWDRAAWHAGRSEILVGSEMESGANEWTIGVALSNCGLLQMNALGDFFYESGGQLVAYEGPDPVAGSLRYDNGHVEHGFWEPYTPEQIESLKTVLTMIDADGHGAAARTLVGHEEIAMPFTRKSDPGPLFPWEQFPHRINPRTTSERYGVDHERRS